MRKLLRNKKALSPVIATVILVSVTIVVAVSVAYWMGTLAGSYTAFEQIEMPTSYAEYVINLTDPDGIPDNGDEVDGWKVHIELKNSGSADATINNIFLNAKPLKDYLIGATAEIRLFVTTDDPADPDYIEVLDLSAISVPVKKGATETLVMYIMAEGNVEGCTSGTRIDLKLHSAAGMDYAVQVKLP